MTYVINNSGEVGECKGIGTTWLADPMPPFVRTVDGDRGAPAGSGFKHQKVLNNDPPATPVTSEQTGWLKLPKGATCGFKETCNNPGEVCMGHDANVSCPKGWLRRSVGDTAAPSGCNFVWCEYQDPNAFCTSLACFDSMPSGLTCGLTSNQLANGATGGCMGGSMQDTINGTAPTVFDGNGGVVKAAFRRSASFYDAGASSGRGLVWLYKRRP
jgi:hypothetical protein